MRIKHIYITKEGEPMANPYQEYPTFNAWRDSEEVEEQAKAQYHSGLLPFEDREKVTSLILRENRKNGRYPINPDMGFKPDTLIPVDLEVDVVEQNLNLTSSKPKFDNVRKVLRIKP